MKKCIALLMTLVMCFGLSTTVFAQDQYISESTASSTVTYHADSFYMVMIPETIDGNASMKLTAAEMNITDNEAVRVRVSNLDEQSNLSVSHTDFGGNGYLQLFREDNNTQIYNNDEVAVFNCGSLESYFSVYFRPAETYQMQAGDYSGTITFNISLESLN